jgi:hypothetical protein
MVRNFMVRTQISIDAEVYKRAKMLARGQGISFAEFCRRSLEIAVAAQSTGKPWMRFAGIIQGRPDDSSTVDKVWSTDHHLGLTGAGVLPRS